MNEILKMAVLNTFFDGGFNGILIPGVGVDYIPLSCLLPWPHPALVKQADEPLDDQIANRIEDSR